MRKLRFIQGAVMFLALTAGIFFVTGCGSAAATTDTELVLDLNKLVSSRTVTPSRAAASCIYYVQYSAQLALENYSTNAYGEEGMIEAAVSSGSQNTCTIPLTNIPIGKKITVTVNIYTDASLADSYLIASGSNSYFVTGNDEFTLTMTMNGIFAYDNVLYVSQTPATSDANYDGTTAETPLYSLDAAYTKANTGTGTTKIVLLTDYTVSTAEENGSTLTNSKPVLLDCGGHTITTKYEGTLFGTNGVDFTLKNGTINFTTNDVQSLYNNGKSETASASNPTISFINCTITTPQLSESTSSLVVSSFGTVQFINTTISNITNCVQLTNANSTVTPTVTLSGSTTFNGGTIKLAAGTYIRVPSALTQTSNIATIQVAESPVDFGSVQVFTDDTYSGFTANTSLFPLLSNLQTYDGSNKVTALSPAGFMYGHTTDEDKTTTTYNLSTGTFDDAGAFTANANAISDAPYIATAFDSNGLRYVMYTTNANGTAYYLITQAGTYQVTEISGFTPGTNNCTLSIAVAHDDILLICLADGTTTTSTFYTLTGYTTSANGASLAAANSNVSSSVTSLKNFAIGYGASTYDDGIIQPTLTLYGITADNYIYRAPIKALSAETLSLNTDNATTITSPLSASFGLDATAQFTDMHVIGDTVYLTASEVTTENIAYVEANTSKGILIVLNGQFTDSSGKIDSNSYTTYGLIASSNYPTSSTNPSSSNAFYGPMKILAVTNKRLVIADDGWELLDEFTLNKIRRSMLFSLDSTSLVKGSDINDYTLTNDLTTCASITPSYTNGKKDN